MFLFVTLDVVSGFRCVKPRILLFALFAYDNSYQDPAFKQNQDRLTLQFLGRPLNSGSFLYLNYMHAVQHRSQCLELQVSFGKQESEKMGQ